VEPGTPLEEVVARLSELPGIGGWTAQYVAMRAYRYPDAFPAGDLGLKRALPHVDQERHQTGPASEKELLARSHAWKPWRAYAAWHLWNCGH
jgi:3-methyladenine DNA glycosylase/8-oxoguanine DNA glycosylase